MNASNSRETIIYVTREIERALGVTPSAHYRIVSNRTPYGETMRELHPEWVTLIDSTDSEALGTGDLLDHPDTSALVAGMTERPYILVFKNTARIEPIARSHGFTLVNPPATASEKIENKISQISWLGELGRHLPPHRIELTKNIKWSGTPFIVQWAHGHTGGGTILITSEAELASLKEKFPERRSRVTGFIDGPSFTLNVVATPDRIIPSSVSYQITGLKPFTESPFSTIGNDWALAGKMLTATDKKWIKDLTDEIGAKMQKDMWRGLFGIDMIRDDATGKMCLIEINARQPASTTFESFLQESMRASGASGMTTFEAHIEALMGRPVMKPIIPLTDGAQIVQRVTKIIHSVDEDVAGSLSLAGFRSLSYPNTEDNADLLRIQSMKGIMSAHNVFNDTGKQIIEELS